MRHLLLALLLLGTPAHAQLPPGAEGMQPIGKGNLRFLWMDVYDATLYAPGSYAPDQPLALRLDYKLALKGGDIAQRSVDEMRKKGVDVAVLPEFLVQMLRVFPDIAAGDHLTGWRNATGETQFFHNDKPIGTIADPAFGRAFFDIWLSEQTSEPRLRRQLLGLAP